MEKKQKKQAALLIVCARLLCYMASYLGTFLMSLVLMAPLVQKLFPRYQLSTLAEYHKNQSLLSFLKKTKTSDNLMIYHF